MRLNCVDPLASRRVEVLQLLQGLTRNVDYLVEWRVHMCRDDVRLRCIDAQADNRGKSVDFTVSCTATQLSTKLATFVIPEVQIK